jgi:hypothetical protein
MRGADGATSLIGCGAQRQVMRETKPRKQCHRPHADRLLMITIVGRRHRARIARDQQGMRM